MMKELSLAGLTALTLGAQELPERILSGYTGCSLGQDDSHAHRMIGELAKYKFNSIEVKIQQARVRKMDLAAHKKQVSSLIQAARQAGLIFQIYLYPIPYNGLRNPQLPEHRKLTAAVDSAGRTVENIFALNDAAVWRELFEHAYQFARLHRELNFATLKFDIETLNVTCSYDDATWKRFAALHSELAADTPAAGRSKLLDAKKLQAKYEAFFRAEVEQAVKTFATELHAIAPDLVLGYMPSPHSWLGDLFERSLATDRTVAIIDGWDLYNGQGWNETVSKHAARVKKAHPNNRFVPWLRPDSYEPADITVGAYYAAAKCDGYSIWVLTMLDEKTNKRRGHQLPQGQHAALFLAAFGRANEAIRADLAEKTIHQPKRIAFRPARSRVAPLNYRDITIPELVPAGSGAMAKSVKRYVLRDRQTVFLYAKSGEGLNVTLEHLAGKARPISLHYALLDRSGKVLREEAVGVGSRDSFTIIAPHTGTYALVVSGGEGGQAWYAVETVTPFAAVDARKQAYFFGPQQLYVPGEKSGNPELLLNMTPSESHIHAVNGGAPVEVIRTASTAIKLPGEATSVSFRTSPASWSQNFAISFPKGKNPFVFFGPERQLKTAK